MQTFLPYAGFKKSARVLDYRRLGKQRVEAMQIVNALQGEYGPRFWNNHPIKKMWLGYVPALMHYFNVISEEWESRGYKHNIGYYDIKEKVILPPWINSRKFHSSHRAALLFKDKDHYSQFQWSETPKLEYVWPGE